MQKTGLVLAALKGQKTIAELARERDISETPRPVPGVAFVQRTWVSWPEGVALLMRRNARCVGASLPGGFADCALSTALTDSALELRNGLWARDRSGL